MRTLINAAGMVLVLAALVTFCVINIGKVDLIMPVFAEGGLEYMAWPLPLCVLILVPLGLGIIMGCLLDAVKIFRLKQQVRTLSKESETHSTPPVQPE